MAARLWSVGLVLVLAGCGRAERRPTAASQAASASSTETLCTRLGPESVCWGKDGGVRCVGPSCIPEAPPPPALRPRVASPFSCDGGVCEQERPRQPDDGEWECGEGTGVTVCRGGLMAAGVSHGSPDGRWLCGDHRVEDAGAYPRVCVDFSPETPGAERDAGAGWSCRYAYVSNMPVRRCAQSQSTRVGDRCASGACPPGSACVSERCVPPKPDVGCFFDDECGAGRACTFGSCRP